MNFAGNWPFFCFSTNSYIFWTQKFAQSWWTVWIKYNHIWPKTVKFSYLSYIRPNYISVVVFLVDLGQICDFQILKKSCPLPNFVLFSGFPQKNAKICQNCCFSHSISTFLHLRNHILSHDSCRSSILQPHFSKLDMIKSKSIPSVICISLHVKVHHFSCRQDFPQAVYLNLL